MKRSKRLSAPNFRTGFTLLECIVAIYVLVLGLSTVMTLTQQSLGTVSRFKNQLIATNLAQEGVELVRNKRDANYLNRKLTCTGACDANNENTNGIFGNLCEKVTSGEPKGCFNDWSSMNDANTPIITFDGCDALTGQLDEPCREIIKETATGFYAPNPNNNGALPAGWERTVFDRRIFVQISTSRPCSTCGGSSLNDVRVRTFITWSDKYSSQRFIVLEDYLTPHLF